MRAARLRFVWQVQPCFANGAGVSCGLRSLRNCRFGAPAPAPVFQRKSKCLHPISTPRSTITKPASPRWREDACRAILVRDPASYGALYLLGTLRGESGDRQEGVRLLREATQIAPEKKVAWFNLAVLLNKDERRDEALEAIDRFLAIAPQDAEAHRLRAAILIVLRRSDEALESARRAVALDANSARARTTLGDALISLDRPDEALEHLRAALALAPQDPEANAKLGLCLTLLERYADAAPVLAEAARLNPDAGWIRGALTDARAHTMRLDRLERRRRRVAGRNLQRRVRRVSARAHVIVRRSAPAAQERGDVGRAKRLLPGGAQTPRPPPRRRQDTRRLFFVRPERASRGHADGAGSRGARSRQVRDLRVLAGTRHGRRVAQAAGARGRQFHRCERHARRRNRGRRRELSLDVAVDLNGVTKGARTDIFSTAQRPCRSTCSAIPARSPIPRSTTSSPTGSSFRRARNAIQRRGRAPARRLFSRSTASAPSRRGLFARRIRAAGGRDGVLLFQQRPQDHADRVRCMDAHPEREEDGACSGCPPARKSPRNLRRKRKPETSIRTARVCDRIDFTEHLASHKLADLFLDTHPYNAHTTAGDALVMGCPWSHSQARRSIRASPRAC